MSFLKEEEIHQCMSSILVILVDFCTVLDWKMLSIYCFSGIKAWSIITLFLNYAYEGVSLIRFNYHLFLKFLFLYFSLILPLWYEWHHLKYVYLKIANRSDFLRLVSLAEYLMLISFPRIAFLVSVYYCFYYESFSVEFPVYVSVISSTLLLCICEVILPSFLCLL